MATGSVNGARRGAVEEAAVLARGRGPFGARGGLGTVLCESLRRCEIHWAARLGCRERANQTPEARI
jgi:hypothetical protein